VSHGGFGAMAPAPLLTAKAYVTLFAIIYDRPSAKLMNKRM